MVRVMAEDVFKALADPTRRRILDELVERDGQTLFEICTRLVTNTVWDCPARRSVSIWLYWNPQVWSVRGARAATSSTI
jgi:DNA-binding transcriptional ArsR family regulator